MRQSPPPSDLLVRLALAGLLGVPLPAGSARGQEIPRGVYQLDPARTRLSFRVSHFPMSEYSGWFGRVSGELRPEAGAIAGGSLTVTIATASVDTGRAWLTHLLRGPNFFDVARYPEIRFLAGEVALASDAERDVRGNLTMLGVTRPATFHVVFRPAAFEPATGRFAVGFSAHSTIKRSDYGMRAYLPFVGDAVRLDLETELVLQPHGSNRDHLSGAAAPKS